VRSAGTLKTFLDQAKESERKYSWLVAVDFYEKSLSLAQEKRDHRRSAEIRKRIGYCLYRSAFQVEVREDFQSALQRAIDTYQQGIELFEKANDTTAQAQVLQCKAMIAYLTSLLASDLSTVRNQLDESVKLETEAVKLYEKTLDHAHMGNGYNNLMIFLADRLDNEWNAKSREELVMEAAEIGEKAREVFVTLKDKSQLALTYILAGFFCRHGAFARGREASKREECRKRALSYPEKAFELAKSLGDNYLIGLSKVHLGNAHLDILGSTGRQEEKLFEKALHYGLLTKDNLLIADSFFGLEFSKHWQVVTQEDPEKAREEYEKLCKYGEQAIHHYSLVASNTGAAMAYQMMLNSIEELCSMETNRVKKLKFIERALEIGRKGLEYARVANSMAATSLMTNVLGTALVCRSRIERELQEKSVLLKEALKNIEESISIQKTATALANLEPIEGNLALAYWHLSLGQAELANIEENRDEKIRSLKDSIENMQIVSEYWRIWIESPWTRMEKPHLSFEAMVYMKKGKTLNQLYAISGERTFLEEGIEAFRRSVDTNDKADLPSRVAEAYWQIARNYSQLAEYSESARSFASASERYRLAAEKVPQLAGFYMDYAIYMQAWSEIEKARRSHITEEHDKAKEHYKKAASLHESTRRWSHLSNNYYAWARLENGIDLSRKEHTEEARDQFQQAADLFREAEKTVQAKLGEIEDADERTALTNMVKVSEIRLTYCLGRISLEEARILDQKGDHTLSSIKYGLAAKAFKTIAADAPSEHERKELQFITYLCKGWEKMALAEAEASPDLYSEAAQLFQEAKRESTSEKAKRLALGHSRFAKALEAGARFEDTRDLALYSNASQHLESAASHYVKAGFTSASEFVKGTQRLFDAYVYVDNAKRETDPEKKARYYLMAERVLQASVNSYSDAKHPEKSEEAQRLLATIREERELATSLSEVFRGPIMHAGEDTFSTPTMTQEKPVGLERFEHAEVEANITPSRQHVKIGEDINLKIDIANAGKGPALLTRIEDVFPAGSRLVTKPASYPLEGNSLSLKGKRLPPLKTEEITLGFKPKDEGAFILKPTIFYVDENGKNRTYQLEPIRIEVSETLPGRITTGFRYLDDLLLGGIPENYTVILTSQSSNDRERVIRSFLLEGTKENQITFHVIAKASDSKALAEEFYASFHLFICNPQADSIIKDLPNVYKLKGVENLTDISIALSSALRKLPKPPKEPRRACIEIVSDILLQHHAVKTRRWLNALIPELKSNGFTTMAVMDPGMHPPQEVRAVLDLFEGEIDIFEENSQSFLRIKRINYQKYRDEPLLLNREPFHT
jgi:KaiC/GvpD/RAD55 family RecA-like ATPase